MAVRIQFRRGTAAEWAAANPTLAAGELGYEVDTAQMKIGNGSSDWDNLAYAAVSASYVEDAIANVVGLSPETLDTLEELSAAIGDNPDFVQTVTDMVADAEANALAYTDNAVATLVNSAPATLDTLSELSAALNNDENFYVTLQNSINAANTYNVGYTDYSVDQVNTIIHTTLNSYATLSALEGDIGAHNLEILNVHGIANTAELVTNSQMETYVGFAVTDHDTTTINVHGIANTADLVTTGLLDSAIATNTGETLNVHGIANTAELVTTSSLTSALDIHTAETLNIHGIANTAELVTTSSLDSTLADYVTESSLTTTLNDYAETANAVFTDSVVLPESTTIGNVTSGEISSLEGVTSGIQAQLDGKVDSIVASSTYAPIANASFTGTVSLPATTSIGEVSATEIGYLNNVSSAIQTQIDAKAPIADPTFTGTVSGITAAMVGLGDVDNTADADKPVSTATQTALDAKADLAGATFTGDVEVPDMVVTGNLIVQGSTTTISASDLSVKDNMIYLNQAGASVLTDAVGDGTNVVYTTAEAHGYDVGDDVTVANTTPSSFNITSPGESIIAVTSNTFTVASTVTDTYVSGGTARGKVHSNPDLGWAAGRYDTVNGSGYAHAGVFRDASDGVFKFFDGYVPEPDESVFIDTNDNTFALADVAVADLTATNVNADAVVFADGTTQASAGVASITGFTEKTASYQLDTLDHKDNVVEMNSSSAMTFTIPLEATFSWPVGASMDIIQTGTGQVTIAIESGGTLNFTPGNKLRTQWSSCTIMKRGADSWILYGDLTA